jgi:hypothetical protein
MNGALDLGVLDFECRFMDALLGTVYGTKGKTQDEVWDRLGEQLEAAVQALLASEEPRPHLPQAAILSPFQSPQPLLPPPPPTDEDREDAPLYPYADDAGEEEEDPLVAVHGPSRQADGSRQPAGPSIAAPPSRAGSRGPSTHRQGAEKPLFRSPGPLPSQGPGLLSRGSLPAVQRLSLPPPPSPASAHTSIEKGKGRAEVPMRPATPPPAAREMDKGEGVRAVEEEREGREDQVEDENEGGAALSQTPRPAPQPVSRASRPTSSHVPRKAPGPNPSPPTSKKTPAAPQPTRQKRPAAVEAVSGKRPRVGTLNRPPPLLTTFPWRPPSAPAASPGDYPEGFFEPLSEDEEPDEGVGMDVDEPQPADAWDKLPRRVMEIEAPTPRLNPATGFVELRLETFQYSYRAKVSGHAEANACV